MSDQAVTPGAGAGRSARAPDTKLRAKRAPGSVLESTDLTGVSPYLCRPPQHFDLMVGPYRSLTTARLRCRQIGAFDKAPGIIRVIKVPSGYWVVRQVEEKDPP